MNLSLLGVQLSSRPIAASVQFQQNVTVVRSQLRFAPSHRAASRSGLPLVRSHLPFVPSQRCIRPNASCIRHITTLYSSECKLRSSHHNVVFVRMQVAFVASRRCIRSNARCIRRITTLYSPDHNVVFARRTVAFVRTQVAFVASQRCIRPNASSIHRIRPLHSADATLYSANRRLYSANATLYSANTPLESSQRCDHPTRRSRKPLYCKCLRRHAAAATARLWPSPGRRPRYEGVTPTCPTPPLLRGWGFLAHPPLRPLGMTAGCHVAGLEGA